MTYQKKLFEKAEGRPMTSVEEGYERLQFRRLDSDGNGYIDFQEFVKFSAGKYLSRRTKVCPYYRKIVGLTVLLCCRTYSTIGTSLKYCRLSWCSF